MGHLDIYFIKVNYRPMQCAIRYFLSSVDHQFKRTQLMSKTAQRMGRIISLIEIFRKLILNIAEKI